MTSDAIEFSIVVPTYQRPALLTRCLRAIEALDFPRDRFELIVVDDGSPTPPADVVSVLAESLQARLVCAEHGGPARARNAAARLARGRYLVFTDDDCTPRPDWLRAIDRHAATLGPTTAIGGQTVNVLADNRYATASQGIVDFLYEYFGDAAPHQFFTSNNLVIPRDGFMDIGGFDETFPLAAAEDRDLCERWKRAGGQLHFAPDVVVDHAHVLDFARFNRQHFNYGRGAFDLHRSRASRESSSSLRLEPVRFYFGLVTYPIRGGAGWRALSLSLLHFWSQVAYASGYFFERGRRGWVITSDRERENAHRARTLGRSVDRTDRGSMTGAA